MYSFKVNSILPSEVFHGCEFRKTANNRISFLLRNSSVYSLLPITHSVRPPKFCIKSRLKELKQYSFRWLLNIRGKKKFAWPREGPSCVVNYKFTYLGLQGWCIETKFPIKQTRTTISQPRTNCVSSVELLGTAYYKVLLRNKEWFCTVRCLISVIACKF